MASQMCQTQIDHVVLLVSSTFFETPPDWLAQSFTIVAGGHHTGQASRNKLIIFTDGTYLELFNWYDKPPAKDDENHPMRIWAAKREGLIDFALTSTALSAENCISAVNNRLGELPDRDAGLGVKYRNPVPGGRKRADGVQVSWKVSRPVFSDNEKTPDHALFPGGRLDSPFFCHDDTERGLRVESGDKSTTTHPCGATGISACEVLVPSNLLSEYVTLYSKVLGSAPKVITSDAPRRCFSFDVGVSNGAKISQVIVREAIDEQDVIRMRERGIGISDLVISTTAKVEGGRQTLGNDDIGSRIWLESSNQV